ADARARPKTCPYASRRLRGARPARRGAGAAGRCRSRRRSRASARAARRRTQGDASADAEGVADARQRAAADRHALIVGEDQRAAVGRVEGEDGAAHHERAAVGAKDAERGEAGLEGVEALAQEQLAIAPAEDDVL